ncbi:MAG: mechanosensitive ion channel domain-containing protein [Bdellovibrionales bacterium]
MMSFRPFALLIVLLAGMALLPTFAQAQQSTQVAPAADSTKAAPAPAAPVSPAPLATPLVKTLQTLVDKASPPAAPVAEVVGDDLSERIADAFVLDVLDTLSKTADVIKKNAAKLGSLASASSDFSAWLSFQSKDSRRIALWDSLGKDFLTIIVPPLLTGIAIFFFFMPLRRKLKLQKKTLPEKVGLLIGLFLLRLVPVIVFLGFALLLLEQNETQRLQRFVILSLIYGLSLIYAIRQVLRGLFSPSTEHLRVLSLSTPQAVSVCRWLSSFSLVIIGGYLLLDVAEALRVPASVVLIIKNFLAIVFTIMAIASTFRLKARVAAILRGNIDENSHDFFGAVRLGLARHWHGLATAYLIIGLIVVLTGVENNVALMLRGTILSVVILVVARLAFVAAEYWKTPKAGQLPLVHRQILFFLMRPLFWVAAAVGIAASWGVDVGGFISTPRGQRAWGAILSIVLTFFVLTVLYEMIHGAIERHLSRHERDDDTPAASARAQTLLPMVRTTVFVLFSTIALFICLSLIGVNIAPLLAGAGIVGVAVGFGSQTLVKDFLTGLFIVAENTIAVGDIVKIDDFSGVVETLSLRTIRLRNAHGALHVLPFSEVSKITNMSRGFSYALVDIGVAYNSDLEHVMKVLREIGASLQEDPAFRRIILEPIDVLGVEAFEASSITIRARMRTRPGKQWDVKRALLFRIKQRFDKEHIDIPFQTILQIVKKE